jgi:hypothetical protein
VFRAFSFAFVFSFSLGNVLGLDNFECSIPLLRSSNCLLLDSTRSGFLGTIPKTQVAKIMATLFAEGQVRLTRRLQLINTLILTCSAGLDSREMQRQSLGLPLQARRSRVPFAGRSRCARRKDQGYVKESFVPVRLGH